MTTENVKKKKKKKKVYDKWKKSFVHGTSFLRH